MSKRETITCPNCHSDKHLILEQPGNYPSDKSKDVEFDCYCTACNMNFTAEANITNITYSNLEDAENGYPFSA